MIEVDKKTVKNGLFEFCNMATKINNYLKEEGFSITFIGLKDTVSDYLRFVDNYFDEISTLIEDINLWINFFADLKGFIEFYYLRIETNYLRLQALNNCDKDKLKKESDKLYYFKIFLKQINHQQKFLINANWHCSKEFVEILKKGEVY